MILQHKSYHQTMNWFSNSFLIFFEGTKILAKSAKVFYILLLLHTYKCTCIYALQKKRRVSFRPKQNDLPQYQNVKILLISFCPYNMLFLLYNMKFTRNCSESTLKKYNIFLKKLSTKKHEESAPKPNQFTSALCKQIRCKDEYHNNLLVVSYQKHNDKLTKHPNSIENNIRFYVATTFKHCIYCLEAMKINR